MLSTLTLSAFVTLFQQPSGEVGWDLLTMWHNMGIPAKLVVVHSLHYVGLVGGYHD